MLCSWWYQIFFCLFWNTFLVCNLEPLIEPFSQRCFYFEQHLRVVIFPYLTLVWFLNLDQNIVEETRKRKTIQNRFHFFFLCNFFQPMSFKLGTKLIWYFLRVFNVFHVSFSIIFFQLKNIVDYVIWAWLHVWAVRTSFQEWCDYIFCRFNW